MTAIRKDRYAGGQNLVHENGLAKDMRDVADDLAGVQVATIETADAGATYTATEQNLLNEIKSKLNALAAHELKTTKEG